MDKELQKLSDQQWILLELQHHQHSTACFQPHLRIGLKGGYQRIHL